MFSGIVTDVGEVRAVRREGEVRVEISTPFDTASLVRGASVACAGVCLTAVDTGPGWFAATVSAETLARTTLGSWRVGTKVNLERSLKLGDELGGHLVAGHVDGAGRVVAVEPVGESVRVDVEAPAELARFIAAKGSVAVDGVSLTVNAVRGRRFSVNLIPHTRAQTTLGRIAAGDSVNVEIDPIARYVARLLDK